MVQMPYKIASKCDSPGNTSGSIQDMVYSMLNHLGEDPEREGLVRTPERFEKAMRELTSGYRMTAADAIGEGIFASESSGLISVRDIEFFSLCEHHLLPFWGHVSIGYLPKDKILGLSKLARVVDVFARRFQVQERLTREIADSIMTLVEAKAVCVNVRASHMCMMMRGVRKNDSLTHTEYSAKSNLATESEVERLWNAIKN